MKFLVTGADGFIGKEISTRLINDGHTVHRTGRHSLDVENKWEVWNFFHYNKVDFVIHTANIGRGRRDVFCNLASNIKMFSNLSNARTLYKGMFCFGSGASFDRRNTIHDAPEELLSNSYPIDYYGMSKNIIAKEILKINDNIVNLRLFGCFGKYELESRLIKSLVSQSKIGTELHLDEDKIMSFFYVEDLYRVITHYIENWDSDLPRDLNCVYPSGSRSLLYIASKVGHAVEELNGKSYTVNVEPGPRSKSYDGSPSKINKLNIDFVGLEEGIKIVCREVLSE